MAFHVARPPRASNKNLGVPSSTNGKPEGTIKKFIDFLKSPEGQKIVGEEGFVGLK